MDDTSGTAIRDTVLRLDEQTLPGAPGVRFNASIVEYGGRLLLAYRNGWKGSDIFVQPLDGDFTPDGPPTKLNLQHRDANYGREDPRLFIHKGGLHISFIGVVGKRRIRHTNQLFARLSDNLVVEDVFSPRYARRQLWEKNWQFFDVGSQLYAVYSITPHRILEIHSNNATLIHETPGLTWRGGEPRGGTPPVRVGNEFWSFFHDRIETSQRRQYRMGLYAFQAEPPFAITRMIPEPLMVADHATRPEGQYCSVIFPCGAVRSGDSWIVSMGVHDRWTELHTFSHSALEARLIEVAR